MAASVVAAVRTPSNGTDATGASLALTIPAGTAIGDYAVIIVELWDSTATNPTLGYPAGFSQIVNYVSTTDGFEKLKVAIKKLTAADSGTYSVTGFASHFRQGHVVILRGIDGTTPLDVAAVLTQNATGTTLATTPTTAITTVTNGALLMRVLANENTCTGLPDTGYTEQADSNYTKTNTKIQATAGTDTPAGGSFSASTLKLSALLAFRPASGGPATVNATLVVTLPAPTSTIVAKRTVLATINKALGAVAATIVAGRTVLATINKTLSAPATSLLAARSTAAIAGTVLPAVTATATGLRVDHGSGTGPLPGPVAGATALRTVSGVSGAVLPGPAAGLLGARSLTGSLTASLPSITATATGLRDEHGSGAATLGAPAAHMVATSSDAPILIAQLPGPTATAAGLRAGHGSGAAALPGPVGIGAGQRTVAAILGATLSGPQSLIFAKRTIASTGSALLGQVLAQMDVDTGVGPIVNGEYWLTLEDLMTARGDQQSIMFDVVEIWHDEHVDEAFDSALGFEPTTMPEPFYGPGIGPHDGKARAQARPVQSGRRDGAGQLLTALGYAVAIPYDVTEVRPTDLIRLVSSEYEPMHVGKILRVQDVQSSSYVTARRMSCVDYQKSAP